MIIDYDNVKLQKCFDSNKLQEQDKIFLKEILCLHQIHLLFNDNDLFCDNSIFLIMYKIQSLLSDKNSLIDNLILKCLSIICGINYRVSLNIEPGDNWKNIILNTLYKSWMILLENPSDKDILDLKNEIKELKNKQKKYESDYLQSDKQKAYELIVLYYFVAATEAYLNKDNLEFKKHFDVVFKYQSIGYDYSPIFYINLICKFLKDLD